VTPSLRTAVVFLGLAVSAGACSSDQPTSLQVAPTTTPPGTESPAPTTTAPTTATTSPTDAPDGDTYFWNSPMWEVGVACGDRFAFANPVVDAADVEDVMFSPGSHVTPHDHMAYWSTGDSDQQGGLLASRQVPLFAPADAFIVDLGWEQRSNPDHGAYLEWGATLYVCDAHALMFGHVAQPSGELLGLLATGRVLEARGDPDCDLAGDPDAEIGSGCRRVIEALVPAGTPLFSSSGISGGFDFGLSLFGLSADELAEHPSYGFSITPWRSASGRSVCPLEYFPEPWRSTYLDLVASVRCGPFNQDVPGTARGLWFPTPSPDQPPPPWEPWPNEEWESIWLSDYHADAEKQELSVADDAFGLEYGKYVHVVQPEGAVNRRWDELTPGGSHCFELLRADSAFSHEPEPSAVVLIELSRGGGSLTIEGFDLSSCTSVLVFGERARTFHR